MIALRSSVDQQRGDMMGNATTITESLKRAPLSRTEIKDRREAGKLREDVTTTLEGEIVERPAPKVLPLPVHNPEPATWD
jgi:hypothetical protein